MTKFATVLYLCFFLQQAIAATATIATASNFKIAMNELTAIFETDHPHQLRQINASSGVLYNQISHGAPFDVLLAANSRYPSELENQGAGVTGSRFTYAEGNLVLVFSKTFSKNLAIPSPNLAVNLSTNTEQAFINALKTTLNGGGKVAIANPDTAPYGIAAQQTLKQLRLWKDRQSQWVRGANIAQCFQFVATGNASLGLVALAQVQHTDLDYWRVPNHWHQPIRQQAILLQSGQHNPAALEFLAFLKTPKAKTIIRRHGYSAP
ncbi:MAG: molybdate ABC transporter substrate-binding protein [Pseudomonadales bacterium]